MKKSIFISTKAGLLSTKFGGSLSNSLSMQTELRDKDSTSASLPKVIIDSSTKVVHLSIQFVNQGTTVIYKSLNLNK